MIMLKERITNVEEMKSWKDQIPFHYEYTAGVAGERFLRGLQHGKIVVTKCRSCGKSYLPPKVYCVDCYLEIKDFKQVGPVGTISAIAESHVDFYGRPMTKPRTFAFVTFGGVTGGLIHYARGKNLRIGSPVAPKFKPASKRSGTLLDIVEFVPV